VQAKGSSVIAVVPQVVVAVLYLMQVVVVAVLHDAVPRNWCIAYRTKRPAIRCSLFSSS